MSWVLDALTSAGSASVALDFEGTFSDSSGHGRNAIAPVFAAGESEFSPVKGVVDFAGMLAAIAIPTEACITGNADRSLVAVVKMPSTITSNQNFLSYGNQATRQAFGLRVSSGPSISIITYADDFTVSLPLRFLGNWMLIVATHASGGAENIYGYLRGDSSPTLIGTRNAPSLSTGSSAFYLNSWLDLSSTANASFISFKLAAAALLASALTSAQVLAMALKIFHSSVLSVDTKINGVGVGRNVRAVHRASGKTVGPMMSSSDGSLIATVNCPDAFDAYAFDAYGEMWASATLYSTGEKSFPSTPNQHWYQVTTAGTSGSAEPTWPTDGSNVTDGTCVWQDMGTMRAPVIAGPILPS